MLGKLKDSHYAVITPSSTIE